MELMHRAGARVAPPDPVAWHGEPGHDQLVVLRNVTWSRYDAIERARGSSSQPLLAYLDGELQLVTTSEQHERIKTLLGRLVDAFAEEHGLRLDGFGHATLRRKGKRAGVEPDNWYKTRKGSKVPDLAIEIVLASGGLDKLEIYRRLRVPEVWFWVNGKIWVYHLDDDSYVERTHSLALAGIDLGELERILGATDADTDQLKIVRGYRSSLRSRRRPAPRATR
jgi:Uma2 family endonuclease